MVPGDPAHLDISIFGACSGIGQTYYPCVVANKVAGVAFMNATYRDSLPGINSPDESSRRDGWVDFLSGFRVSPIYWKSLNAV